MILVDCSVWIDHFRRSNARLVALLEAEQVLTHPFVIGEIACGNLKNRKEIISLLHALPSAQKARDDEILLFIDAHELNGRGVGLVDVHLLASCLMEQAHIWTADKRLKTIAEELRIEISQQPH